MVLFEMCLDSDYIDERMHSMMLFMSKRFSFWSGIVEELKHDCLCPIRQSTMQCPVVAADGHSYDRKAIQRWVCAHGTSPMTNMPLANMAFVPNILATKVVSCLGRADPSWLTSALESGSDGSESSEREDPHAWSSDHSSEREVSEDDRHQGQAAEVLRALLSHDEAIYGPVEALWNIRNGDHLEASQASHQIPRPTGPMHI